MSTIRIDIVDDHKMVLAGLKNILQGFPNIVVGNLYDNGTELIKGLKIKQPDVLLMDIQMPDVSGEELAPLINKAYPDIRILIMTGFDTTYYAKSMMEKGATGYLLKNAAEATLKEAIETVSKGAQFIDPSIKDKLLQELLQSSHIDKAIPTLTRREKEILGLIMQEQTGQQIATALNLSLRTIENQRVNLMQKMGVKNTVGLVKKTIEWKLID
jgi:DNA-binding NarL/FixJ family response regulator